MNTQRVGAYLDPLILEYMTGRIWALKKGFRFRIGSPDGIERINVFAGFITDFASVPRPLWMFLPPTGSYGKAAVLHDWLYRTATVTDGRKIRHIGRAEADSIFYEAMTVSEVGWFLRWLLWLGVRVGGWRPWNRYRYED